jgi:hypothetical protein
MNKMIEGLKLVGAPVTIPDCTREDLPQFFVEMGYKAGAEIGVYHGDFTKSLCKSGLEIYGIDPWMPFLGQGRSQRIQEVQDTDYNIAKNNVAEYKNCSLIRKPSMEALGEFPDENLDFVYIDADHSFRYFAEDIVEWSKKVRKGGAVCGHDYFHTDPTATNVVCHVDAVVDAYTKIMGITNWYIFGGRRIDKKPSWMFIKN